MSPAPIQAMYYSSLRETALVKDISDPAGGTSAVPATLRIHALHISDGKIACGYTCKDGDIADPGRDWFDVPPREVPCEACLAAIQPPKG
jgi:hypothetical protein